jgi:hypothetical protein
MLVNDLEHSTRPRNHDKVNGTPNNQRNQSKELSQSCHPSISRPSPPGIKL